MASIIDVRGFHPKIGNDCFLAENATIIGDVVIGDRSSVCARRREDPHARLRARDEPRQAARLRLRQQWNLGRRVDARREPLSRVCRRKNARSVAAPGV